MKLWSNRYGKAKVRVLKKLRENGIDTFKELEVKVILEGAFDTAYSAGDNREIVATDTMKNTVNVFAYEKLGVETEPFVVELAAHFLDKYPQVSGVEIETEERVWERITKDGSPSPTNFSATMLSTFGSKESPSVQTTLYEMGKAALAACSEIDRISLTMPNLHCLLIDLAPFRRPNQNTLFLPTDAPQGWIEGTVARGE
jgi:urate oxidase